MTKLVRFASQAGDKPEFIADEEKAELILCSLQDRERFFEEGYLTVGVLSVDEVNEAIGTLHANAVDVRSTYGPEEDCPYADRMTYCADWLATIMTAYPNSPVTYMAEHIAWQRDETWVRERFNVKVEL